MASWASTTEASGFDAEQYAQGAMDSRSAARSGSNVSTGYGTTTTRPSWDVFGTGWFDQTTPGGNTAQSLSGYSVVGINAAKVPDMREAIRTAVSNLQGHIDGIEEHTNSSMAFKSEEVKSAVENYVLSVKEYCKALISDLLAFSDKLETVHQAWLSSTSKYASESIEGSKGSLSDNTTYYTEQY